MATNGNHSNSGSSKAHGDNSATFEQCFARLQEVVSKLSEGNLTLQEALGAFEEGMGLADRCSAMLDQAELRVKQVSDRALRSGAAALAQMDDEAGTLRGGGGQTLVAIEIERYEATLEFEDLPSQKPAQPAPPPEKKPAPGKPPQPLMNDLDPLFDDED
jgi:exodeoxyribonuclease VII small subunit